MQIKITQKRFNFTLLNSLFTRPHLKNKNIYRSPFINTYTLFAMATKLPASFFSHFIPRLKISQRTINLFIVCRLTMTSLQTKRSLYMFTSFASFLSYNVRYTRNTNGYSEQGAKVYWTQGYWAKKLELYCSQNINGVVVLRETLASSLRKNNR